LCLVWTKQNRAKAPRNEKKEEKIMNNITEKILAHIRDKVKETLEEMIKEERRAYLEGNMETKANGYYLRNLNTPIGRLEGLRVARTREGS